MTESVEESTPAAQNPRLRCPVSDVAPTALMVNAGPDLKEALTKLVRRSQSQQTNFLCEQQEANASIARHASKECLHLLGKYRESRCAALVIRDAVEIDEDLEPTPRDAPPSPSSTRYGLVPAAFLIAGGAEPISYMDENEGELVRHIVTKRGRELEKSSHGRASHWHTEHAQRSDDGSDGRSAAPDGFGFLGLRNQLRIPTEVAELRKIARYLPPEVLKKLELPREFEPSASSTDDRERGNLPIVVRDAGGVLRLRFNEVTLLRSKEPSLCEATDLLLAHMNWPGFICPITLGSGDVLLLNQRLVAHRHGGDTLDPERWLLRVYGMRTGSVKLPTDVPWRLK